MAGEPGPGVESETTYVYPLVKVVGHFYGGSVKRISVVIYHAPNWIHGKSGKRGKVGCTQNLEHRKSEYDMRLGVKILEKLTNVTPKQAGDREDYWSNKLGYENHTRYERSLKQRSISGRAGGKISGANHVKSGFMAKIQPIGASVGGRWHVETGNMKKLIAKAALSPKRKEVFTCPHCDKSGKSKTMFRWHFDNCDFKEK